MSTFLIRLAATLGLNVTDDEAGEEKLSRFLEQQKLRAAAAEQERDIAQRELAAAEELISEVQTDHRRVVEVALEVAKTESAIANAYRDGRLRAARDDAGNRLPSPKEGRLRRIAEEDGLVALLAEISDMPVIIPIGKRTLSDDDPMRERGEPDGFDKALSEALGVVAEQLGHDPALLRENAEALGTDTNTEKRRW